ncbi:hypothetical protein DQ04_02361100 [Trypanosoma grayi]|uniref:hypothetical protein n=1 Tax=Trypanosoma grayi TaxID=71804 RepID=UPI0004F42079|nr:hypothetical protein DQ04_02361100 [Trypanosoma grayi]KEG11698.1 hypothetical protein DQ04_02361100 [Trypanosoma grayi]
MASVEALLRLPTDEARSCPPVDTPEEVLDALRQMETILRKCLYAVRYALVDPFTAFLDLLLQLTLADCERVAQALLAPAEEGRCIDLLASLCGTLLIPDSYNFRHSINMEAFFEFVQLLCASPVLKDPLGAALMPCLLAFVYEAVTCEDDYRQPRAGASLLITLIRGSKANKNRMSIECGRIGEALAKSSDIFFQMQCVEVMFRLYTHNRTALLTSTLPEFFKKGVAELPNDASLLTSIQSLLDVYNVEYRNVSLLQFTALLIEVGSTEVCGCTNMYFSPLILVIMLPGRMGDNITIPYEHIRSVKLSKERKLGLRLHVIPGKLSNIMNEKNGRDTLMISLTQSTFSALRSSGVHQWISDRKRRVPFSRIHQQMEAATAAAAASAAALPTSSSRKNSLADTETSGKDESHLVSMPVSGQASARGSPKRGGVDNDNKPRQNSRSGPSSPQKMEKQQPLSGEEEKEDVLRQLRAAAAQKVARMRQDCQAELQCAVDFIQEELEKMHRCNARERDDFEATVREDLTAIRRAEAQVKAHAAERVQSLNQELTEVQALGEMLKGEVNKLRDCLAATLHRSEAAEENSLVRLKTAVDADVKAMEETLLQVMSATSPLSLVTTYLSQKVGGAAA